MITRIRARISMIQRMLLIIQGSGLRETGGPVPGPRRMWAVLKNRVPFRVLFARAPFYFGGLKRDPDLENYPCGFGLV